MIKIFIPSLVVAALLFVVAYLLAKLDLPLWTTVGIAYGLGWLSKLIDREMTRHSEVE